MLKFCLVVISICFF